jgi:hypothetical protein
MIPVGTIALWSSTVGTIPGGWSLCDGNNGTPDLRNLFIPCAGATYNPGNTGGNVTHLHAVDTDHNHYLAAPPWEIKGGNDYTEGLTNADPGINTDIVSNLPPYYALPWIMKN